MLAKAPLECPANYFGKGEDYILPEDQDEIREFEQRFQQWEKDHPEDPTGEIALRKAKANQEPTSKTAPATERKDTDPPEETEDMVELELTLPARHITLLKNYAKFKRRRPRDIVLTWIEQFCRL